MVLHFVSALALVLLAWVALHAGTLWLNAALDRDEGEVLWGRAVPVPANAALGGYAALVGTVVLNRPTLESVVGQGRGNYDIGRDSQLNLSVDAGTF